MGKQLKKVFDEIINEMRDNDAVRLNIGHEPPEYMCELNIGRDSGVVFGREISDDAKRSPRYVGKPEKCDGHILVVGGTGSGKSTCIARPSHLTWKGAIVSIDIKGEWDGASAAGRPAKVLSLTRESNTYDPFHFIRQDDPDNLVQNAYELAQAIIPLPQSIREPFWIQSAQNILTAAILYYLEKKNENGKEYGFIESIRSIMLTSLKSLIKDISDSDNELAKMFIISHADVKNPSDSKMLHSIDTEFRNKLIVFATDNRVARAFASTENSIKWEDLASHNIFISIPEDKLEQYGNVVTLMLTQLIRSLERRPNRYDPESETLPPVLLLLDEFPRFGKLNVITNALATLRSKGVTICLFIQSLAQLDSLYGEDERRVIVDNCSYKAILSIADVISQKYFSDLIGTVNSFRCSINENFDAKTGERFSLNLQRSQSREPVVYPHELATLKHIALVTPEGFFYVKKIPLFKSRRVDSDPPPSDFLSSFRFL